MQEQLDRVVDPTRVAEALNARLGFSPPVQVLAEWPDAEVAASLAWAEGADVQPPPQLAAWCGDACDSGASVSDRIRAAARRDGAIRLSSGEVLELAALLKEARKTADHLRTTTAYAASLIAENEDEVEKHERFDREVTQALGDYYDPDVPVVVSIRELAEEHAEDQLEAAAAHGDAEASSRWRRATDAQVMRAAEAALHQIVLRRGGSHGGAIKDALAWIRNASAPSADHQRGGLRPC